MKHLRSKQKKGRLTLNTPRHDHKTENKKMELHITIKWKLSFLAILLSFVNNSSAGEDFAHTINGKIVCNDVIQEDGIIIDDNGSFRGDTNFACIVDPGYAVSESKYIELALLNLPSSFENDRKAALKTGRTRLTIFDGTVEKSTLILPDNNNIECSNDLLGNGEPYQQQCYATKIVWHSPQANEETSPHQNHSRKLAVNQTGNRKILVFRITTTTHGSPTASAADVSDQIFGPTDDVNIVSQFADCSNSKLTFSPATITGTVSPATLAATGVYDISVTGDTSSSTATDIKNLVIAAVEDSFLGQADHIFYHVVSIFNLRSACWNV